MLKDSGVILIKNPRREDRVAFCLGKSNVFMHDVEENCEMG